MLNRLQQYCFSYLHTKSLENQTKIEPSTLAMTAIHFSRKLIEPCTDLNGYQMDYISIGRSKEQTDQLVANNKFG